MSSCQTNIWGRILNTQITEVVAGKPDSFTWVKPGFELHINISADFNLKSTMFPLFHMVRFPRENPGAAPSPWYILDLQGSDVAACASWANSPDPDPPPTSTWRYVEKTVGPQPSKQKKTLE